MNYLEAEKNLCQFIANASGLVPDREIFAGELPPGVQEGISVSLEQGQAAALNTVNDFRAAVKGRFFSRLDRFNAFDRITAALPVYSTAGGFLSIRLSPEDPFQLAGETSGGRECFVFHLTLCVSFV